MKLELLIPLVCVIITLLHPFYTTAQVMSQAEFDSVLWIIRQSGASVNQTNSESVCADPAFVCQNFATSISVKSISLVVTNPQNVGSLPLISNFTFPQLTTLTITFANGFSASSTPTLSMVKNLPSLSILSLTADPTTTQVPPEFPFGLPKLIYWQCQNCPNLTSIPVFFNNSILKTLSASSSYITDLSINPTLNLPNLTSIHIGSSIQTNTTWNITQQSFPSLSIFNLISRPNSKRLDIYFSTNVSNVDLKKENQGTLNSYFSFPQNLSTLHFAGAIDYYPSDLSLYTRLSQYQCIQCSSFPLVSTTYPPTLNTIIINNTPLGSLPNIPFPPTLTTLILNSDSIQGSIPAGIFDNVSNLQLNIMDNPGLTGSMPEQFCKFKPIKFNNTGFNALSIPDCFHCYYYSQSQSTFQSNIPPYPGFVCNVIIDRFDLPSLNGKATITGRQLGWGTSNLTAIVPNEKLLYSYSTIQAPQTIPIELSPTLVFNFTVFVADINISTIFYSQTVDKVLINIVFTKINSFIAHTVKLITNDSIIPCFITSINLTNIDCYVQQVQPINYTLVVSNDYYSETKLNSISFINTTIPLPQLLYPMVSAVQSTTKTNFVLFGNFGNSTSINTIMVTFNSSVACGVTDKVSFNEIHCTTDSPLSPGSASVQVSVDGFSVNINNGISVSFPPSVDLKQQCIERTTNCYGHGECNDQGECICQEQGYQDNCRFLVNPNTTFIKNETQAVAIFKSTDSQGINSQFMFEMVAIQELDSDDSIINELFVKQWDITDQSTQDITSLEYQLKINTTESPQFSSVNVTTLIEYSNQARDVVFGNDIIQINGGSVKVGVNVTGWQYSSIFSHLRVIFSTIVNTQQSLKSGCGDEEQEIPTFENTIGSDSYLRVIKDNTQFYGRFLSYSYSDGRKSYSMNELINQTIDSNNNNQSFALIGIHFPQCQSCLLDPDFSALIVSNNEETDCQSSSSNTWKIAVGVSVGGAVFIAIVVAAILRFRKTDFYRFKVQNISMTKV